ncbi:MAG TPA: hypothetical protein VFS67_30250 [Polyangiaceae bacterium]|nr:hypothetical protein [Polyangiaceae bacterium]
MLGALEIGRRLGRAAPIEEQASTVAAPILALVGLLLAFSFSMAGDRQATRRAAILQEVNSIETFWLRTSLVPEPTRSEMRDRVRRYVDLHFEHLQAGIEEARTQKTEEEAARLQQELWALLIDDARREPEASRQTLVIPALNSMLNDTVRVIAARENRLPDAIYLYLFLLVVSAGVVVGYRPRNERTSWLLWTIFTVVVSGVLLILLDLDRPRRGLLQTDTKLPAPAREPARLSALSLHPRITA